MKKISNATIWVVVLIVVVLTALTLTQGNKTNNNITFDVFQKKYIAKEIKSFQVKDDDMTIDGKYADGTSFETVAPVQRLVQFLGENPNKGDISESYTAPVSVPMWVSWLPSILSILLLVVFWFVFMQQSQGGAGGKGVMSFGKSKAKVSSPDEKKKVTFGDVAGADEEKQELSEIVDFLKAPKRYLDIGARIPKGILLVGPPGTGKTLLARAVSGEAGVPFYSISGSDFVEMFVGVGASRVRDLFEQAKKTSPCIIFIDEIDAVGRQRGAGLGGGHDEREQTLNQLLVEMDGFGINEGIIILAATNRPDILDRALLRPGRFDRQIMVGAPDVKGREDILKVHSKNKHLEENIKLDVLAKRTPGFTGADLENLMNEAALLSVRKNKTLIGMDELEEAITRIIAGPEKRSRIISEEDRRLTAFHEAGHAVVMKLLSTGAPVHQISIVPRGMAGGYTMKLPDDSSYMSKTKLEDEIVGLLGGRVAEKLVIGDISTGAKSDIDRASSIARKMIMEYGMSDNLGPISFGTDQDEVFLGRDLGKSRNFSEEVGAKIDIEVKGLIVDAYKKAETLLSDNMNKLKSVAEALLDKEKLEADEFEQIFANS
ncbi:ATP-dependent zinc metalloprotease FtsH [Clostridium akagii]|uniref:ATP-dependent zinc metalloprotease FtsH n=1 Tax=Clostridium akagii TaxID=91623 RepID=UPI00047A0BFA|nr:ATP-dependent zinc metalloprotease FtsH [Clostridium akagii]